LHTKTGDLALRSPAAYQAIDGQRKAVTATYVLADNNEIRFRLGSSETACSCTRCGVRSNRTRNDSNKVQAQALRGRPPRVQRRLFSRSCLRAHAQAPSDGHWECCRPRPGKSVQISPAHPHSRDPCTSPGPRSSIGMSISRNVRGAMSSAARIEFSMEFLVSSLRGT
jgi:hypothetical protein